MREALQDLWTSLSSIPHVAQILAAAYVTYLLVLACYIVLQERDPVATLSWILSLAALPYIGLFVFYLFGPQKIVRQRLRRGRSREGMSTYDAVCPPDASCTELARVGQATTGLSPSTATDVDWLLDGAATYAAIIDAIGKAQRHVNLEYYIFEPDHAGTAMRDALVERARAGIKVRLLLDAVGSSKVRKAFLRPLLDAGAEMAAAVTMIGAVAPAA